MVDVGKAEITQLTSNNYFIGIDQEKYVDTY